MLTHDPFADLAGYPLETTCRLLHAEFFYALSRELAATQEADLREAFVLPKGTLLHRDAFSVWYEFKTPARRGWMQHRRAVLRIESRAPIDTTISLGTHAIVLRVDWDWEHECPDPVAPGALLWPDRRWLLEGVLDRITLLDGALATSCQIEPPFHPHLALAALGLIDFKTAPLVEETIPADVFVGLNEDQRSALLQALGSSAWTVWGPPGTGKSRTLAAIVEGAYHLGESMLLAAPTHVAADVVLDRVCDRMRSKPGYGDGLVLRLGSRPSTVLPEETVEAVQFDRVLGRKVSELRRERDRLQDVLDARPRGCRDPDTLSLAEQILALDRQISGLPKRLIREARVVSATMHGIILSGLMRRAFERVMIDEVPMGLLPATYAIAGMATKAVVMAGDHLQLPPPVATSDPRSVAALATDPIRLSGQADLLERGRLPPGLSILRTQYRMRRDICEIVNTAVYRGLLRTAEGIAGDGVAVTLVDTSDLAPQVRGVAKSRECPVHALVTTRLAEGIALKRLARGQALPHIRVLTPYRAQARLIRHRLHHASPDLRIEVSTVHSSQASEAEVVLIDICECPGLPAGFFLRGDSVHATSARLLNVAITRAQAHLVVVCDVPWVTAHGGTGVGTILDSVARVGSVVSGSQVLARLGTFGRTKARTP